jgi:hypothetical protein
MRHRQKRARGRAEYGSVAPPAYRLRFGLSVVSCEPWAVSRPDRRGDVEHVGACDVGFTLRAIVSREVPAIGACPSLSWNPWRPRNTSGNLLFPANPQSHTLIPLPSS